MPKRIWKVSPKNTLKNKMTALYSLVFVFIVLFLYYGVPCIYSVCMRLSLKHRTAGHKTLVLTLDDGPGSRLTPAVLRLLAENNVKATFFLLGRNIKGREQIVKQIAEQGHQICSHGYEHLSCWKILPFRAIKNIKSGWQAIDSALGSNRGVYPFRPPYGKLDLVCLLYLLLAGVPVVYWTVSAGDTGPKAKRDSKKGVLETISAGGGVFLIHDNDRIDPNTESMVLESIRSVLVAANKTCMRVVTVSQLFSGQELTA